MPPGLAALTLTPYGVDRCSRLDLDQTPHNDPQILSPCGGAGFV
jgi:hypothetical protein